MRLQNYRISLIRDGSNELKSENLSIGRGVPLTTKFKLMLSFFKLFTQGAPIRGEFVHDSFKLFLVASFQ